MEGAELDRLVMKPTARRRLGKYVLLGRLGAGGMGKIYLAHAPGPAGIDKLLVVKRLHSHLTSDPVLVNSFLDEARLSMALNHPNIGHTFDVGEIDGRYFMVMEYIDGQNLGVVLRMAKRSGKYPSSSLWAGMFLGVLDGLHAAHTARDARGRPLQIIHRDVSPQNVLLTYDGLPKLVDFGIAKAAMRVHETDAGTLKGKYAYMSPEQVRGTDLDARSDVFAAGIVLWEMLAGRRLYKADTIVRSVERILEEPLVSPVRVNPACDPDIAKVALKALAKKREDRWASAEAMRNALEDALQAGGHRYRPSDGKELMTRLFADVIDKQRAMLEATLNHPEVDDDDDDDDPRRRDVDLDDSESRSDLRMPDLGVKFPSQSDSTTPSAMRRRAVLSPLVTEEGDSVKSPLEPPAPAPPPPLAPTASAVPRTITPATTTNRKRPSKNTAPVPVEPATSTPPTQSHSYRDVLAPPLENDEPTATGVPAPTTSTPTSRRVPIAAALGLLVLAFGGLALWWSRPETPAADDTPPRVADAQPELPRGDPQAPIDAPPVGNDDTPGDTPTGGVNVDGDDDGDGLHADVQADVQADVRADVDSGGDEDDGTEPPTGSQQRPTIRRSQRPRPRPKPAPVTTTATPGDDLRTEAPAEEGFLTLDTVPWTTVYLGKKKLGETPLVKVPVPVGELELTLVNTAEGVKEAYVARIKPGTVFRTRLDLR